MTSSLRVSAELQPQHADWPVMRKAWVEAEELGVDCLFNWDHSSLSMARGTASTSRR